MIKIAATLLIFGLISTCKVTADYPWATPEEQAQRAGVVFKAKVTRLYGTVNSGRVAVSDVEYYKGCGPTSGIINGFRSSASCGIDRPSVGTTMIFFVCDDGTNWTLNDIAVATGAVEASPENIAKIEAATEDELRCFKCSCRLAKKCTKRPQAASS